VSISAGYGYVSQAEKFGRDISGAQYKNYIHLRRGNFAYNKGNSNLYPQGCVYQLKEFDEAAASNAFICFKLLPENAPGFFEGLFEKNAHGEQLKKFLTSGARSDGLLNIKPDEFFSVEFPIPHRPAEQQKIADCLSSLDELIGAQGRKVDALRTHKKGLMQQLFPREGETQPRLRFPEFQDSGDWEETTIGSICRLKAGEFIPASDIKDGFQDGMFPCYGGNGRRGYVHSSTHEGLYVLIGRQGALCGNVNLISGRFHATEHALVVTPQEGYAPDWLFYAFNDLNLNRFSIGQAQPGLSVGVLNNVSIVVPRSRDEQQRIASCLSSLDDLITAEVQKLDALKTHKRGLMQQLFPSPEDS
jgi:type I restriction enzyme S subunit